MSVYSESGNGKYSENGNGEYSEGGIAEEKQRLRIQVRRRARELSTEYMSRADRMILEHLTALDIYRKAETVCCYAGIRREIHTRLVFPDVLNRGKRLCVPLCVSAGLMEMHRIVSVDSLHPGTMGIPEPSADTEVISPAEIDLMIVPCLSCDTNGWRLGYGGGYYDRYLPLCQGETILLCREQLLCPEIPHDVHDICVRRVLTEEGLYENGVKILVN